MDAARWFELAEEQMAKENYHEAKDLLSNAIQFDKTFTPAYEKLALVHIHRGEFKQALEQYNTLLELENTIETRIKRAGLYLVLERDKDAEMAFTKILEEDPENLDALKGLGDSYFRQQNFKNAIETYDTLLELQPDNAFLWYSKAETYYRAQNHERAFEAIEKAIELEHAPEFFAFKGDFFIRHENFERALEQYRLAANLAPRDEELHLRLGFIYRILDRRRDAIDAFDTALKLNPYLTEAIENKIEIYQDQENLPAALGSMEQLVRLHPEDLDTGFELVNYYMDNEGYERAAKILEILIEEHYENSEVWYTLANCLFQIKEYERALQAITKAIDYDEEGEKFSKFKGRIEDALVDKSE